METGVTLFLEHKFQRGLKLRGSVERAMEGVRERTSQYWGVEKYDFLIKNCAEETLQKIFRRNVCGGIKTSEPIWMTEGLRREIKNRKNMSKSKRNCKIEDREKNLRLYIYSRRD